MVLSSKEREKNKNMIIRQEKLIDFDFNNTGEYKEMDVFYKVFEKNGEIKEIKISDDEASLLEFEGFPLIKTNKQTFLHD